jgi:prepilin-type N-terminal cleavage/methylation domain-containing protein
MKIKEKGFSILELMTTIAIISIIGAVGFPAIDNFGDQDNFESDLATIRGQINYVRQLSLEDGNAYTIRIINDTSNNTADLERLSWRAKASKAKQSKAKS